MSEPYEIDFSLFPDRFIVMLPEGLRAVIKAAATPKYMTPSEYVRRAAA
jgi:hypothetical protein